MMSREPIEKIEFKNMSLSLEEGHFLYKDVNFLLPLNKIVWVRGEGKSVFLKMLMGLIEPTQGEYLVNSKSVNDLSFEEFLPIRCNFGYGFDFGGLLNNRDIVSNLMMATEYHEYVFGSPDQFNERVLDIIDTFDLKSVMRQRPSAIIGGLRKAACVARAFVHDPELIALDDPTTGLRKPTVTKLKNLIQARMNSGGVKHVIISSNDSEFMNSLNPTIIEIEDKKIQIVKSSRAA
jgi:phospholipid/cholesterol/gamma-HCH transport system ATP-binding protein